MNYTFRPATREAVGLFIGIIGASGSGKTYSAMRLASGIVGQGDRFAMIDTESRRSLHYADMFSFDILDLHPPFRPEAYAEAVKAASEAGYKAIVVDSMSHEWAGEGGVLDWQEEELTRMAGDNYQRRESCKMAAWIKPKMGHKQMVQKFLQVNAHLILCFRAEEKVKMEKVKDIKTGKEKTEIIPIGWQPICSKEIPYEMTVSFLLTPDRPGYPQPLKLQEQHKPLFQLESPLSEASGEGISKWAAGGKTRPVVKNTPICESQRKDLVAAGKKAGWSDEQMKALVNKYGFASSKDITSDVFEKIYAEFSVVNSKADVPNEPGRYLTSGQVEILVGLCQGSNVPVDHLCQYFSVKNPAEILGEYYMDAQKWVGKQKEREG